MVCFKRFLLIMIGVCLVVYCFMVYRLVVYCLMVYCLVVYRLANMLLKMYRWCSDGAVMVQ